MNEPQYHLSGIVRERGALTDFQGPLTLIIQLLGRNRIEVSDVSLSLILKQYLDWLAEMAELDLEIASEFISMASHLMYIKSKTILGEAEPSELRELIESLEKLRATDVYNQIKAVGERLSELFFVGAGLMTKLPEAFAPDNAYRYSHAPEELASAYEMTLLRTFSSDEIVTIVRRSAPAPIAFPIERKIAEILKSLAARLRIPIIELFRESSGRSEMVAAFLATLELCSSGAAAIDDMCLVYRNAGRQDEQDRD